MQENENHEETDLQSDLLPFVHHGHRRLLENSSQIEAMVEKQKFGGTEIERTHDISREMIVQSIDYLPSEYQSDQTLNPRVCKLRGRSCRC